MSPLFSYPTVTCHFSIPQRHMESLEEGVLQQQRQRFEEMQAYLKAQHAAQMAAISEGRDQAQNEVSAQTGVGELFLTMLHCSKLFDDSVISRTVFISFHE